MAPINPHEVDAIFRKIRQSGSCSYPTQAGNECSGKITDAHTVQRRGGLRSIAEDGHVLTVLPSLTDLIKHEGLPPLKSIGVARASVFPGFCNRHDTQLFQAIEQRNLALNASAAFRFSYRAVAFERFRKLASLEFSEVMRQFDAGKSFEAQADIQQSIHYIRAGTLRGIHDLELWKAQYDDRILAGQLEDVHFWFVRFDRLLPLVGCAAFYPEVDFNGVQLQRLVQMGSQLEHVALNITSYDNETVGCVGWIGSPSGPSAQFVNSMSAVPKHRIADAFVRVAFEHSENIYLRPSWWDGLSPSKQAALRSHMRSGGTIVDRQRDCLVDQGIEYIDAGISETSAS